jgi:NAD(P)-dependent dehydrogenase (short-subunit alcohol dehydrogenase family)
VAANLAGQVALITGCGRYTGLGRAIARELAMAGADVAVTDVIADGTRNSHETQERERGWQGLSSLVTEIEQLGVRACSTLGSVAIRDDVERMVSETVQALGHIDILVNNAAAPHAADRTWSWEVPEEAFDLVLDVNTKGLFLMSCAVIRHMLGRDRPGRIINIASTAGRRGNPQRAAYCASKFAVIGLTQTMALELATRGVTVNAVCPGAMDTARVRGAKSHDIAATGYIGDPIDIARTVAFLADPASKYITGESIVVSGGSLVF